MPLQFWRGGKRNSRRSVVAMSAGHTGMWHWRSVEHPPCIYSGHPGWRTRPPHGSHKWRPHSHLRHVIYEVVLWWTDVWLGFRHSTFDCELLGLYLTIRHFRLRTTNHWHSPLPKSLNLGPPKRQLSYIIKFTTDIQHVAGKHNLFASPGPSQEPSTWGLTMPVWQQTKPLIPTCRLSGQLSLGCNWRT